MMGQWRKRPNFGATAASVAQVREVCGVIPNRTSRVVCTGVEIMLNTLGLAGALGVDVSLADWFVDDAEEMERERQELLDRLNRLEVQQEELKVQQEDTERSVTEMNGKLDMITDLLTALTER